MPLRSRFATVLFIQSARFRSFRVAEAHEAPLALQRRWRLGGFRVKMRSVATGTAAFGRGASRFAALLCGGERVWQADGVAPGG